MMLSNGEKALFRYKNCRSCKRTFGLKAEPGSGELLLRDADFPDYCNHGCAAVARKWLQEKRKAMFNQTMAYLNSGELKTTLIGRAFDLSQEESKEAFAEFISNFMTQVETWELKKSQE